MKIASLALASALAAAAGCAQPAFAQSQDQTGATNQTGSGMNGGMMNHNSMMNRMNRDNDDQASSDQADSENSDRRGGGWNWHHGSHMGSMGPMRRHDMMMMRAMGGAHFRFVRGNTRVDVRCSVQEDTQACVRAAGELLDKIAQMHRGGGTTGSAPDSDESGSGGSIPAPGEPQVLPGQPNQNAPGAQGERM